MTSSLGCGSCNLSKCSYLTPFSLRIVTVSTTHEESQINLGASNQQYHNGIQSSIADDGYFTSPQPPDQPHSPPGSKVCPLVPVHDGKLGANISYCTELFEFSSLLNVTASVFFFSLSLIRRRSI